MKFVFATFVLPGILFASACQTQNETPMQCNEFTEKVHGEETAKGYQITSIVPDDAGLQITYQKGDDVTLMLYYPVSNLVERNPFLAAKKVGSCTTERYLYRIDNFQMAPENRGAETRQQQ